MPHIVIRYSNNLENANFKNYLVKAHQFLADKLPTKITSCRSMVIKSHDFLIGNHDLNIVFIHVDVLIKAGRDLQLVQEVGNQLIQLLKNEVATLNSQLKMKTSVEIREIDTHYFS